MMEIHGDPGHSCYDEAGKVTCVIAKIMLRDGPDWRELALQRVLEQHGEALDRLAEM